MVSLSGKLDWNWNKLKGKTLDTPMRDFLHQIICSRTTHLKYDSSHGQPTSKKVEKRDCAFLPVCLHSVGKFIYLLLLCSFLDVRTQLLHLG